MSNANGTSATSGSIKKFAFFGVALSLAFCLPLWQLVRFALHDDFFSYIPLIPFITGYLIWLKKPELPKLTKGSPVAAIVALLAGAGMLVGCMAARRHFDPLPLEDYLACMVPAYLFFLTAGALFFLGAAYCRVIFFPITFMLFMIPMPTAALDWTESFFQVTSAATASGMLSVMGMPVLRTGLVLDLPGFAIEVAPECSGIHATIVLLMTSMLAGYLFLRSPWKRILLVVFVVPLAILRNGFRIFVISELCVRISHDMINSPIHRQGGPLFFALSLIPFFLLLFYLRKTESPRPKPADSTVKV